ncbi:MAG: NAD-dependent epimerase/dehydratase family protein [Gemmataceae bacterium]
MRVLILGCGYLGRRVATLAQQAGATVLATTRHPDRAAEFARLGLQPVLCDVVAPESLRTLPEVDQVVYCVGLDRAAGVSMRRVYVEGLGNVLAALPGQPRIVHVSSTSVYGQTDGSPVDESAPTEPLEESGQIVLDAEKLLCSIRPEARILRFAGIYGPGRLIRARDLLAGRLLAIDPDKWLNLVHVDDGAAAVMAALARGSAGVYNVADGTPVRRRDFYTFLANLLGAPDPRFLPPPEPTPVSEKVNRQIVARRLRDDLGVIPRFPSYAQGLPASLDTPRA